MFNQVQFDNRFTRELPADRETGNKRRQVVGASYSRVNPQTVPAPELIAFSPEVVELLEIERLEQSAGAAESFVDVFSGNKVAEGMDPHAMCYGGHQFGNWAGQLGDGRAINLGAIVNSSGQHYTLQLKGAGPTPYSRRADGLAVLRSSVREFLCSEAMYHLGVPTTRALSLIKTGENVVRDMFYDGNPQYEHGAVVCRVSPSFLRFGSFEILTSRNDYDLLRRLADFGITQDFPHLGEPSKAVYAQWFNEICERTATLMVDWMRVGFVHGVMNTDNLSILGETIDYGSYGWLEDYDPDWTPNTTDAQGKRYRYGNQPAIGHWNLAQLGNALFPLIEDIEPLQQAVDAYQKNYTQQWQQMMVEKLGFKKYQAELHSELIAELEPLLQMAETDMTIFYRNLALITCTTEQAEAMSADELLTPVSEAWYQPEEVNEHITGKTVSWIEKYLSLLEQQGELNEARVTRMNSVNPKYVLRNYLAQLAIDKADEGDFSLVKEQLEVLKSPYTEQPGKEQFSEKRPEWARHRAGCSMLSCSS